MRILMSLSQAAAHTCTYIAITLWPSVGSGIGSNGHPKVSIDVPITLIRGTNKFDLLSLTVGLQV